MQLQCLVVSLLIFVVEKTCNLEASSFYSGEEPQSEHGVAFGVGVSFAPQSQPLENLNHFVTRNAFINLFYLGIFI
jgi:hypothetical protein